MKTALAFIGGVTILLGLLASFGVGHFVYMYNEHPIACTKENT